MDVFGLSIFEFIGMVLGLLTLYGIFRLGVYLGENI